MSIVLRPGTAADAAAIGTICYEAFKAICTAHNFPPDFPSPEVASGLLSMLLAHPGFYSVVAEGEGRIVGSNFLDERSCIAGVGPITVDPTGQNRGVGGRLMQDVLDRTARQQKAGLRLLQSGFHNRSLCLYTKLGFRTREPVSILQGKPLGQKFAGYEVRPVTAADVAACNRICLQVHGFDRAGELRDAIDQKAASVVEHLGRITGYTTGVRQAAPLGGASQRAFWVTPPVRIAPPLSAHRLDCHGHGARAQCCPAPASRSLQLSDRPANAVSLPP
jgi:predicted N-acetyltransferase YhbS